MSRPSTNRTTDRQDPGCTSARGLVLLSSEWLSQNLLQVQFGAPAAIGQDLLLSCPVGGEIIHCFAPNVGLTRGFRW